MEVVVAWRKVEVKRFYKLIDRCKKDQAASPRVKE
jgi:hypothetical protein